MLLGFNRYQNAFTFLGYIHLVFIFKRWEKNKNTFWKHK
jgi:hypothetical protein